MIKRTGFIFIYIIIVFTLKAQTGLKAVWDDGLKFRTENGKTELSVGGRIHYDLAYNKHDGDLDSIAGKPLSTIELRRARLSFEGVIENALEYEFEFSFGEEISFADLYLAFIKLPFFEKITVGHFREPFGMEENTTSNSIVFMERSLSSTFGPGRNAGIMLQRSFFDQRARIYAGLFRLTNSLASDLDGNSQHSISSRLAVLPVWDTSLNKTLHLGLSTNFYSPIDDVYELNVENPTHTGGQFIKSGTIPNVDKVNSFAGELGYTYKKFALMGEYMHSFVRIDEGAAGSERKRDFNSFYLQASMFLGRGKRSYDLDGNEFSDVSVAGPVQGESYRGAWEVGVRYARVHLKESVEEIKKMNDITIGLNWYYRKNIRFMANQIFSRIENRYNASATQFRVQVVF